MRVRGRMSWTLFTEGLNSNRPEQGREEVVTMNKDESSGPSGPSSRKKPGRHYA